MSSLAEKAVVVKDRTLELAREHRGVLKAAVVTTAVGLLGMEAGVAFAGTANEPTVTDFVGALVKEMSPEAMTAVVAGVSWASVNRTSAHGRAMEAKGLIAATKDAQQQFPEVFQHFSARDAYLKTGNKTDALNEQKEAEKAFAAAVTGQSVTPDDAKKLFGRLEGLYNGFGQFKKQLAESTGPKVLVDSMKEGIQMATVVFASIGLLRIGLADLPTIWNEHTQVSLDNVQAAAKGIRWASLLPLLALGAKEVVDSRFSPGRYFLKGMEQKVEAREARLQQRVNN